MCRALSTMLLMILPVTALADEGADGAKMTDEKLATLAKSLRYPEATNFYLHNPKSPGAQISNQLHSGALVTKDELKKVRDWYIKKLSFLEGMGEHSAHILRPGEKRSHLHSVQANDVVFKEPLDEFTKRSVSVFTLTRRTDDYIAFVVLTRAKDEDHTHILLELIPFSD